MSSIEPTPRERETIAKEFLVANTDKEVLKIFHSLTAKELEDIYLTYFKMSTDSPSADGQEHFLRRWSASCQTTYERKMVYYSTPDKSKLKKDFLVKWLNSPDVDVGDIRDVYDLCHNQPCREFILDRWNKICLEDLKQATAVEQIVEIYRETPYESSSTLEALVKWNQTCLDELNKATAVEQIEEIYWKAPKGGSATLEALVKWNKICLEEFEQATTFEQIEEIYWKAPEGGSARVKALAKIKEIKNQSKL